MAEMRTLECPSCESSNQPRNAVDGIEEYRCRSCGLVYYGPCGCDTSHKTREAAMSAAGEESRLPGDWQMAGSALRVENGSAALSRPGGC